MKDDKRTSFAARIWISDPWDFGTECGVGPFEGVIVQSEPRSLLIRLDAPIDYRSTRLVGVIAQPRHVERYFTSADSETIPANFMFLSGSVGDERIGTSREFVEEFAAIGALKLIEMAKE